MEGIQKKYKKGTKGRVRKKWKACQLNLKLCKIKKEKERKRKCIVLVTKLNYKEVKILVGEDVI